MKAVIAEKPSVAREIAALLGASEKMDGFLAGNGYMVTWAFGHLVVPAMPEDYGICGFQKSSLPILPDPFILTVRKIKKDKVYVTDAGASKQLKIINQVIQKCDSIIVATDAGREGELIFRYIYQYLQCNKPFERLWISSLTEKAIKQGFQKLQPGDPFNGLYQAALCRSQADWIVGINASQALSIAASNGVYSLGRVQSPTLALICRRWLENENFQSKTYWQVQLEHRKDFVDFKSLSENKFDNKKEADAVLQSVQRSGIANITATETKTVTEQPPLLFDLTGLQKEANKKLDLSAEETLNIAQELYEKKFISYPRTGSRYIPEDVWAEIPALVRALETRESCKDAVAKMKWGRFNKRIVNDLKVTDHHGLLITEKIPSVLSAKENAVYDLIALRLLESLSHACIKEVTDIKLHVIHHPFSLRGCKITEPGWRVIKGNLSDDDTATVQELPALELGEALKIAKATLLEKKTKAPLLYTEATLLSAMEHAGKEVENDDDRKALQAVGIGTPATRAAIIETLFKREYIKRNKKSLIPTSKGMQVYHLVKNKKIADVAMTAEWENALQKIETKELDAKNFHQQMEAYATSITYELLNTPIQMEQQPEIVCPRCKKQYLVIKEKLVKCPDETCNWIQFRSVCGIQISIEDIKNLLGKRKTSLLKGMKSKAGKTFNAYIVMNENSETSFEFDNSKPRKNS